MAMKDYIKTTLKEERLWKVGEADMFNYVDWKLKLTKSSKSTYTLEGEHKNGQTIKHNYADMEDVFLNIVNNFYTNSFGHYDTLEEYLNE